MKPELWGAMAIDYKSGVNVKVVIFTLEMKVLSIKYGVLLSNMSGLIWP